MFKLRSVAIALTGLSTLAVGVEVLAQSGMSKLVVAPSSFVSPLVDLFGDVAIGEKSFVASNTIVSAEPGTKICIGNETNLQDNIHFLASRNAPAPAADCGAKSSSTQNRVSIAHQAVIKNSKLGNFNFVGFRARITNSTLEDGVFVLHGATVTGVRIPKDRIVPIGAKITTQAQANALKPKAEANSEFQNEVLEVNEEFAEHYNELYQEKGYDGVTGVGAAPKTSWNTKPVAPTIGKNVRLEEFARIVGDVRLGANSVVGERSSIRADEGAPIIIGNNAEIEDRVTFHALKGTNIKIGNGLNTDDNIVFHGPLEVGNNLTIGDDAVLFKSKVGNNVTIGTGAVVVGVTLRDRVSIPDNALITTQAQADKLPRVRR
ncbi:carbonic anhydrase [Synechocystis sp. PCC 7509]|uniref:carbonic anhydrase n=1 Tax=Synechocystis sp. PCC 7509 TaxID=927677 RepID=UPI0002AC980C|nr:carbonic anhydrase [Synechocystis sp. PCC 7509]